MDFDRPRNWKWMVPASLSVPFLILWNYWQLSGGPLKTLAPIMLALSVILGLAALINGVLYVLHYSNQMYTDRRTVENQTPEVRMFEAARGMHPEAVKALLLHRRTIWRLKYVPHKDLVDWVLDEAPEVHAGFIDFVLDKSNLTSVMSKRMLSEGSKKFDPQDLVTDYEQYDALLLLMRHKLMVTESYGNQAAQWIPPWNPETTRHRFGLDGDVYGEPDGMLDVVRETVSEKDTPVNGNGKNGIYERALDGLEQTRQMKAATDRMMKS